MGWNSGVLRGRMDWCDPNRIGLGSRMAKVALYCCMGLRPRVDCR